MALIVVEQEGSLVERARMQSHGAPDAARVWHTRLVDVDAQARPVPVKRAAAQHELVFRAADVILTPFGHRPTMSALAVNRDIERAVVERVAPPGPGIVGREHATDEGDDRDAVLAVIAQCVEIPPGVAARRDRSVEAESCKMHAAAIRPDIATIGTPGPGCTLPPAR